MDKKAALAERYVGELPGRLAALPGGGRWRFRGEHGGYELATGADGHRGCSCPFFAVRPFLPADLWRHPHSATWNPQG